VFETRTWTNADLAAGNVEPTALSDKTWACSKRLT
jgi:hypothetical protein